MIIYFYPKGSGGGGPPTVPTAEQIANAVWNAQLADHTTAGSFGVRFKKLLTVAKFLGLK